MKPDCSSSLRYQMWFWVWYFASYLLSVIFCHSISNGFSVQFSYLISDSELDISNIHTIRTGGGCWPSLCLNICQITLFHWWHIVTKPQTNIFWTWFLKIYLKMIYYTAFKCSFIKPYWDVIVVGNRKWIIHAVIKN